MEKVKFPFDELRKFHASAVKELDLLGDAVKKLEKTRDMYDFEASFKRFFNFCGKQLPVHVDDEEHALFPMISIYMPDDAESSESIMELLTDHKDVFAAMEVIKLMKRLIGGEKRADKKFIDEIINRTKYIRNILEEHFDKEDETVYAMAEDAFTGSQVSELADRMSGIRERHAKIRVR